MPSAPAPPPPPLGSGPSLHAEPPGSPHTETPGALHTETLGSGGRLVLAHGFTQTGRVWGSLDTRLAADHRVVRVDLPGHGRSDAVRADLVAGAGLLGDAGGRAAYLGYSMGARFCLHLALVRPAAVERLVLVSGTAGIDDPGERADRRRSDEALADELDPTDGRPAGQVGPFLERWLAKPMFAGIDPAAGGMPERLTNTAPGLASSLRLAGTGTQVPLWSSLHRIGVPVLVVTGEHDAAYSALGRRLVQSIGPKARHAVVAGTGHAPHLQDPATVAGLVRRHLDGPPG